MIRRCRARHSVLLVVDVQERLAATVPETQRAAVAEGSRRLVQAAALLDVPVVVSEQYPKGLGPTLPALAAALPPGATPFAKTRFSCAGAGSPLDSGLLDTRPQVVLAGMETHVCILQTALDLLERGRQVFVVEDAVCSRRPQHKANALARLRQAGAVVSNLESVLFEWLEDAAHPRFKEIAALVRDWRPAS